MSPTRTSQRITVSITIAFAGAAIALAGIVSGNQAAGPASRADLAAVSHSTGSAVTVALTRPAIQVRVGTPSYRLPRRRGSPQRMAWSLLRHRFGWKGWQFKYLNRLWAAESGWDRYASNPYSGAYGIPQAVPGSKMASAGPGWRWNARTQILWGLRYIAACYRTPYWAWLHQHTDGWY